MKISKISIDHGNSIFLDNFGFSICWVTAGVQRSYQIIAATSLNKLNPENADLWNSGEVFSSQSVCIPYEGIPILHNQTGYIQLRIREDSGWSEWSDTLIYTNHALQRSDWTAKWITDALFSESCDKARHAPIFSKCFELKMLPCKAILHISGLGYYEAKINGVKVGDKMLTPSFTRYDKTVLYDTYEVTSLLTEKKNKIEVTLGNGFFNSSVSDIWGNKQALWRDHPKMICQLEMYYVDNTKDVVVSDSSWKVCPSKIAYNQIRSGEYHDASYSSHLTQNAIIARPPGGWLKQSIHPPERVVKTITAINIFHGDNSTVFDFGENISGVAELNINSENSETITLKYSELLNDNFEIDQTNINELIYDCDFQTDRYISLGKGEEKWHPAFVYHGFRYVEIMGYSGEVSKDTLVAKMIHSDLPKAGSFYCSNDLLNLLQDCIIRSAKTNFHGFPTDCPHREKNGWTGDGQISAEQMLYNFDMSSSYKKWLCDMMDAQLLSGQLPGIIPTSTSSYFWGSGPAWDSAIILLPWYLYLYTGDLEILRLLYPQMMNYIQYLNAMSNDFIVDFGLGDWCYPQTQSHKVCETAITDTGYYYSDVCIMAKISQLLHKDDTKELKRLSELIKGSYKRNFYQGGLPINKSQTSLSSILYHKIDDNPQIFDLLLNEIQYQNNHIDCGILGAKYLLQVLTDYHRPDLAYQIVTQKDYPGWGYWISEGATTLWEHWEKTASRNHHMFSDVGAWMYKALAGISVDPNHPGFKNVILKPSFIRELDYVEASHRSRYGDIDVKWVRQGKEIILEVNLPQSTTADLILNQINKMLSIKVAEGKHCFIIHSDGIYIDQIEQRW